MGGLSRSDAPSTGASIGVEVAGIEPASSSDEPGLLRAQLVMAFCSAPALALARRRQAQSQFMFRLGPGTTPSW